MTDDANRWQQLQSLFEQAIELPESERLSFLTSECSDDDLRAEVESLLHASASDEDLLERSPLVRTDGEPALDLHLREDAIPGYRVLREIARGAQGIVYCAEQLGTRREVALKVMWGGPFADRSSRLRFEREVEVIGSLRHSAIVQLFDSGLVQGQYYYAMELVDGEHLDLHVRRRRAGIAEVLDRFMRICDAVNHAHQHGVIHRDLKPSNILVDDLGNPHVLDFGIAKLTIGAADNQDAAALSITGHVFGTLAYMSPEHASARPSHVDTRSDVYSLGVILYELLADRLPYDLDGTMVDNLATIQSSEPKRLRAFDKRIDNELETIILKALDKDPDRRYQTAGEFGRDIGRLLRGETIEAKRDSILYLMRKTVQRHRVVAGVAAASAVLILLSAIVGWGLYLDAEQARQNETVASLNFQRERDTARKLRDESQIHRYFVEMDLAGRLLGESGGIGRIEEIVSRWQREPDFPSELPGWEWHYLNSRLDRYVHELKLDEVPNCARFSPDGKWIAFGDDAGIVRICPTGEMSKLTQVGKHDSVVRAVSWSSDGRFLASGSVDQKVFVYDVAANRQIATFSHDDHVISVQWHPQHPVLASSSNDGIVKVWRVIEEELHSEFDIGTGAQSLDWSNDGHRLAVGTWAGTVRIWDLRTRKLVNDLTGYSSVLTGVRWNGNGKRMAVGGDNGVLSVRNIAKGSVIWELESRRHIRDLTWSPDSAAIAVVGNDRSIKIWSPFFPALLREIEGHRDAVWSIDWSTDGEWLLTASHDYTLKVWRAYDPKDDRVVRMPSAPPVFSLAWKPDDTRIAVGTDRAEALIFDVQNGKLKQYLDAGYGAKLLTVAWSPDGLRLASGGWDGKVVIWDTESGEKITEFDHYSDKPDDGIPNIVNSVAWSRDGKQVASSCYDSSIFVWNPENGDLIKRYAVERGNIYCVDWHPVKPDLIAASTSIHGAWIWSLDQQQPVVVETDRNQSRCIRWNPDGTRFAVCRDDGLVTIHDSETTELQASLKNHLGLVGCVDWHPDGKRLATASDDGTVRIWDAETATQAISFDRFEGPVSSVAWSHDGSSLAVGGRRGIVRIFDATAGYERASQ